MSDQQWNDFCTLTGAGWHDARMRAAVEALMSSAAFEAAKPKCPDCNSVGMSHCSDPENCGGVYYPDSMYRKLEVEIAALEAQNKTLRDALIGVCQQRMVDGSLCFCWYEKEDPTHVECCQKARAALSATEPQTWQTELRERTQGIYRKAADHAAGEIIESIESTYREREP
jgi:hypothetical protein